jgi:SAM-dependent methyltransferase
MASEILQDQVEYYRARAGEYDEWWFRTGRYDRGPEFNSRWQAEVAEVEEALANWLLARRPASALELACGTGLFTRRLAPRVGSLTAVDASPEVMAINRARVGATNVEYVEADLFAWRPTRRYDVVFFSFWLSHVPEARFAEFWRLVRAALAPGGRVFLVDSGRGDGAHTSALNEGEELRRLADGREFRIVKRYFEPRELERRLAEVGFAAEARTTANGSFLYASCG